LDITKRSGEIHYTTFKMIPNAYRFKSNGTSAEINERMIAMAAYCRKFECRWAFSREQEEGSTYTFAHIRMALARKAGVPYVPPKTDWLFFAFDNEDYAAQFKLRFSDWLE
jgi:hypothetical protein